jgi:iron complex transport system ATP-binding protein
MNLLKASELTISIGSRNICQNFNFSLQQKEIWGVLGPNGVGKTTLLHTFAGIHRAKSGEVTLQDQTLRLLSKKAIARQIGLLFQSVDIHFPQTVMEYIQASRFPHNTYFKKISKNDLAIIDAALECTWLESYKNRNIQTLSGGETRRLAIAAILAQTPCIYLLDEPTNHLDMHYQLRILTHFQQLAHINDVGIIMSLHDINLAQKFCTHVLLMFADGNMQQGRVCDILTAENLSRLYNLNMQAISANNNIIWNGEI